ncbi:MAG: SH3 domain-containing protein [Tagaea sp.]|nr:SH3 domain-containing protein [Tagaea sp.]
MQASRFRRLIAAFVAALIFAAPVAAQEPASPLDDSTGFWLVAERGPPVNETLANIPIFGANLRPRIGHPRAVWDVRREDGGYAIEIRPRGLVFKPARFADGAFAGETADPDNPQGRVRLEARIADGRLTGKLVYADFELALEGRPPESIEALRQAYAMTRARLDEFEGPYALPEIERLRAENLVLIERIGRVEGELRARGLAAPAPRPAPLARTAATIATRGLAAEFATQRATALRAAPDDNAEAIQTLAAGRPLIRLAETARAGWALVSTQEGALGYVPSAAIVARAPAAAAPRAREIQVAFPVWDQGRAGRRMTVSDPGFVSLVGRVRADAALAELRIADAQVVFNADGSFTAVVEVPREGRRVRIEAVFAQGPNIVLEFDVAVGPRGQ